MSNDNLNSSLTIHMLKQLLLSFLFRKDSTSQTDAKFRLLSKLPQRKNNILWQTHRNLSYFLEMGDSFLTHIAPQTFFHSLLWEYILVFQGKWCLGGSLGPSQQYLVSNLCLMVQCSSLVMQQCSDLGLESRRGWSFAAQGLILAYLFPSFSCLLTSHWSQVEKKKAFGYLFS